MTDFAMNAKETVVSVWRGDVNAGEFIGSAFFVSPSLLLTAKHVVRDESNQVIFKKLYLDLVQGLHHVDLQAQNIYCHEDLDIALIYLDHPNKQQALCTLNLHRQDYREKAIDCFGINKNNYSRDSTDNNNVGTLEQKHSSYSFDHRVKKGFSGGAVCLRQSKEVIGITSRRDKNDQGTLFIPLYSCKDWLIAINEKLNDPVLADSLKPPSVPDANSSQHTLFANSLEGLTIFIGRPLTAYQHIMESLKTRQTAVKICLCLYTSEADNPDEFTQALAFKLAAQRTINPEQELLELVDKMEFDAVNVEANAWQCKNYDQFRQRCMADILASFGENVSDQNQTEQTRSPEQRILTLLRNSPSPKVLKFSYCPPFQKGIKIFSRYILNRQLKQRFQWVNKFNNHWQKLTASEVIQPLAFLFFVRVDDNTADTALKCFRLKEIDENAFNDWTVFVRKGLTTKGFYRQGELFTLLKDYRVEFNDSIAQKQLRFPLTYQDFITQTKNSQTHAKPK